MRQMHIRFLINSLNGGGAEKVLINLIKALIDKGIHCDLLTIDGGVHENELPANISYRKIIRKDNIFAGFLRRIVYYLPPTLFCRLFMREGHDIEIAYLEGTPTRMLAALPGESIKIAFVHCDLSITNPTKDFYRTNTECLAEYKCFSKVCFVSCKAEEGFYKTVGQIKNGITIHNVIDFSEIIRKAQVPCTHEYHTKGMRLVTVGRLTAQKAFDRLLRIAKKLESKYEFELWILGDGELRQEYERYIIENEIQSVKLLGYRENPYSFMIQADLFVCSSIFEGYSTAATEATALGLPVLTTACAGMDEILDNGKYGIIVENSEDALQAGLEAVLSNRELYKKLNLVAKERGTQLRNRDTVQEYIKLFEEIIDGSKD